MATNTAGQALNGLSTGVFKTLGKVKPMGALQARKQAYVFTGYRDAASRNSKPTVMDALHASSDVHQPVGTAASVRGSKLGDVVLARDAKTAACMNFHRSTPWRRQVS